MPPEEVQLETPETRIASTATIMSNLRRRPRASGSNRKPQARGSSRHPDGRTALAELVVCPVRIWTVTLPLAVAGICGLAEGLNAQAA
jgi:hypothetical protein